MHKTDNIPQRLSEKLPDRQAPGALLKDVPRRNVLDVMESEPAQVSVTGGMDGKDMQKECDVRLCSRGKIDAS